MDLLLNSLYKKLYLGIFFQIQTQIARGRIFDADMAGEASRLAKQEILAGAASQMISLASVQKRSLIDTLI